MAVVTRASAWGRLRAVFCSRAIADARGGPTVALGEYRANSPCLALRWAHDRAGYLADQLDAPYARPVRAWLRDTEELEWALAFVAAGEPSPPCTGGSPVRVLAQQP